MAATVGSMFSVTFRLLVVFLIQTAFSHCEVWAKAEETDDYLVHNMRRVQKVKIHHM